MTVLARISASARHLPASRSKVRAGRLLAAGLTALGATPAVVAVLADGSRMLLDGRSRTEAEPLWNGAYEPDYISVLCALVDEYGSRFLDIGANVGLISVPVGRHLRGVGQVCCVEPVPDNASRLRQNLDMNDLGDARVQELALGDSAGTVSILRESRGRGASGNAVIEGVDDLPRSYATRFEVPLRRLDDLVDEGLVDPPDVVKIDVEGSEVGVLRGGSRTFHATRPVILGEFNSVLMPNFGTTFLDAAAALPEDYAVFAFVSSTILEARTPEVGMGDVLLVPREKVGNLPLAVRE